MKNRHLILIALACLLAATAGAQNKRVKSLRVGGTLNGGYDASTKGSTFDEDGDAWIGKDLQVDGTITGAGSLPSGGSVGYLLVNSAPGVGTWTLNIDLPGTLDVTDDGTFDADVFIGDDLRLTSDLAFLAVGEAPVSTIGIDVQRTTNVAQVSVTSNANAPTLGPRILGRRSRGESSPSAVANNSEILQIHSMGYDGDSYELGPKITLVATETWTNSARGSKIVFSTTDNGSTTLDKRFTIDQDGKITGGLALLSEITVEQATATVNWKNSFADHYKWYLDVTGEFKVRDEQTSKEPFIIDAGALNNGLILGSTGGTFAGDLDVGGDLGVTGDADYGSGYGFGGSTISGGVASFSGDLVSGDDGTRRGTITLWDGGAGSAPGYVKLHSPNGTARYLFVEDDGTLKIHNAVPTQNSDGSAVGGQS